MRYLDSLALGLALFPGVSVAQGYTNESEVPLYGLSPPVYPTREYCCRDFPGGVNEKV